jgi:CheY-like chemotaxis protein
MMSPNLELLEGVLAPTGNTIRAAAGGHEALKVVDEASPT